jgi:neutral ceramidase
MAKGKILAGSAKVDITPPIGTSSEYGETTEIDLPLYSRALVLDNGEEKVAISTNDLIFVDLETVHEARRIVHERTGIPNNNILFCSSHTHEGPITYQGTKPDYLIERVSEALCKGWDDRREARLGAAKGQLVGITINRRNPYGPIDPDVSVLKVVEPNDKPIAVLFNFACHGVVLGHHKYHGISPDYPGHAEKYIEELTGNAPALFANGPCANINPYTSLGYTGFTDMGGTVDDADRIGRLLALEVAVISEQIQTTPEVSLVALSETRALGRQEKLSPRQMIEKLTSERNRSLSMLKITNPYSEEARRTERDIEYLNSYKKMLDEAEKTSAYLTLDKTVDNPEKSEIQVIGINDIRLVGVPGEYFTEYGLYIKEKALALGYPCTIIAELTNGGWWGYIPTEVSFEELGYEALNALAFAGLSPKAGQIIADTALELIARCGKPLDPPPRPFIKRPLPNSKIVDAIKPLPASRVDRLHETLPYNHELRTRRLEDLRGI